jgi:hypothetical protein
VHFKKTKERQIDKEREEREKVRKKERKEGRKRERKYKSIAFRLVIMCYQDSTQHILRKPKKDR